MVEHLQSSDQTMAPEDSVWQQAMPQFCEIGCRTLIQSSLSVRLGAFDESLAWTPSSFSDQSHIVSSYHSPICLKL